MNRFHAHVIVLLSLLLLTFVAIDFFQVKQLVAEEKRTEQKSDLVEKANQIGSVLGDQDGQVLPGDSGGSKLYKFYLKDQSGTAITSQENTDKALIKGATVTITNKSSFTCGDGGANYSFTEADGKYYITCNEQATMNIRISKSGYSTKNTSVSPYQGDIPIIYLSRYVAPPPPPPPPPPETIKDVKLPAEFSETGGSTNLAAISDPSKVENLTLDTDSSTIKYKETVDLSATDTKDKFKELNKYVKADQLGVVGVDSASLPALNKKATIVMKSLTFIKTPKILVDGKENKAVVSNIVYKDGTLTFDVTNFSTFTVAPTVEIKEPANNFETKDKKVTLKGNVSDPTASVSAQLNNKDLGKLEVATTSGDFSKEIELDEGTNKIVINALGATLATASASVSGTLLKSVNMAFVYLLLVILLAIGGWGLYKGMKKMRANKSGPNQPKAPVVTPANPV